MLRKTKRRYVSVEIESEARVIAQIFMDALWGAIVKLYGEYGASQTGLKLIDYNQEANLAIIRISLTALEAALTAIASITNMGNAPTAVRVTAISGTLKSLRKGTHKR